MHISYLLGPGEAVIFEPEQVVPIKHDSCAKEIVEQIENYEKWSKSIMNLLRHARIAGK
jgi:hypothetical protein